MNATLGIALKQDRVRGILLMISAFATFALLDATAKYLSQALETPQIVWARYAGHFVFAVLWFAPRYGGAMWRSRRPGLQVVRSLLILLGTAGNFFALRYLQLAETSSIFFSIPLIVAALSVPLLGERVGPQRWAAIVIGFLGVLVVVRPGLGVMHWAAAVSLASALCIGLYQIATRMLAGFDDAYTTQFYTALIGVVAVTPIVPFFWTAPDATGWLLMIALGLLGGIGHYLLILAHGLAPAPVLAPFSYTQIVWMVLLGLWIFGDLPDRWTVVGGALVIASGLYLLSQERRPKDLPAA